MPLMDGYICTRKLRENAITLPIVALSANAMYGTKNKCLTAGMDDFILKPFQIGDVNNIIHKFVS